MKRVRKRWLSLCMLFVIIANVFSMGITVEAEEGAPKSEVLEEGDQNDTHSELQIRIDALPTVTEYEAMDKEEQDSVYAEAEDIAVLYEGMTEEEQAEIDADKLLDLLKAFSTIETYTTEPEESNGVATIEGKDGTYDTLQAAIDASGDSDIIYLWQDISEHISSTNKNYTLDLQNHKIEPGGNYQVYCVNGGEVTLKNGTLTGGNAANGSGLGIYNGAVFSGENLTITKNTSTGGYGAVFIYGSSVALANCKILDNTSAYYGGGIALYSGTLVGSGITVSENKFNSTYTSYQFGGGIYTHDAASTIELKDGSVISDNSGYNGAGIYSKGDLKITDSEIKDNTASRYGGGIYSYGGSITLENGSVTGNKASTYYGGGIYATGNYGSGGKTLTIDSSEISGNTAGSGGGVYAEYLSSIDIKNNSTISNNEASTAGGGLDILGGSVSIKDTTITGNTSRTYGAAAYISCGADEGEDILFDNVLFSDNESKNYGTLDLSMQGRTDNSYCAQVTNSSFTNNEGKYTIRLIGRGNGLFDNCSIKNNNSADSTIYLWSQESTEFKNCEITDNTAVTAGGIRSDTSGTLTLTDSVVKGNSATEIKDDKAAGGIYVSSGSVIMTGGAVYDNRTEGSYKARDWYIAAKRNVSIPAASTMKDGEFDFTDFVWRDTYTDAKFTEALEQTTDDAKYLVAVLGVEREIARNGDEIYYNLASAVDEANENDKIVLTAGENDDYGTGISSETVTIDKSLTLDVNGRTVNNNEKAIIKVTDGAALTITGTGQVKGTLSIEEDSSLLINGGVQVGMLAHNGDSLTINATMSKLQVSLAEDKFIILGDDFECDSLEITLADEVLKELNTDDPSQEMDVVIAETKVGGLADKITVAGLTNKLVSVQEKEGKLVLHKTKLNGIYIDGVNGNDENEGSYEQPVKTFERAKELLENSSFDTIYVLGQITLTDTETWELDENTLARYPGYKGCLVSLSGSSSLTLKDIVIDGASEYGVNDAYSMIKAAPGAKLVVEKGTVLQNNDVSGNNSITACSGGAIYSEGTLTMNGGTIQKCSAVNGGGIYCYQGTFTLNNGSIINNENYANLKSIFPSGGGVLIDFNAQMIMNGGTISDNKASYGGGVALGGNYFIPKTSSAESLEMNGGKISENTSTMDGGGIFIQSTFTATVNAGYITENSGGSGNFGGGGIYVNGGKEGYTNGRLQLYNVLIANNKTELDSSSDAGGGAGIAGCNTSNTRLYIENGGVIYQNTANGIKDDILISNSNGASNFICYTKSYISEFMLGGGTYLWKWVSTGTDIGVNSLHNDGAKGIYTERTDEDACIQTAKDAAKVFITGNTARCRGGGIGSNGDVYIGGMSEETIDISVTKIWDDDNNANHTRPDNVKIWLLRNGEKVSCLEFRVNYYDAGQGKIVKEWQDTLVFTDQPKADEKGNLYTYTVEEEVDGLGERYASTAEKISDTEWKVTNTLITTGSLNVSKTVSGGGSKTQDFTFTVKLSDDTITGEYGEMTFENGTAVFTLHDGQSVTASGLPEGTAYTVEESGNSGYTVTVNSTADTTASGTITAGQIAEAAFNNAKVDGEPARDPDNPGGTDKPGKTDNSVTSDKAGENKVQTGDNACISIWLVLMAVSVIGICVVVFSRRRKR